MTGIRSLVELGPLSGATTGDGVETITAAYDRARHTHQGFNYQDRLVIRNLSAPPGQQEAWSMPYSEGAYEAAHRAMIQEIHRICMTAALQAHEAIQKATNVG